MGQLVVSAFGVHYGGSIVLLEALLRAARGRIRCAYVDTRAMQSLSAILPLEKLVAVAPTSLARLSVLRSVPLAAETGDRLLCFNSLPPLARSSARTITYVHTPHMAARGLPFAYSWREVMRMRAERALFRAGRANSDAFWVQTPTVASAFAARADARKIEVVPFIDEALGLPDAPASDASLRTARLIYPADGIAHKNHVNLFRAWALLAREGFFPALDLTLRPEEFDRHMRDAGLTRSAMPHIHSQRFPRREQVLEKIREADAMIFPSRAETFGIPFIEATVLGTPILAAEADFVRDVCVPAQTFDPASPRSIADAVLRFLGAPRSIVRPLDAEAFVERIFSDQDRRGPFTA